eukprot:TRINITY_DN11024_c0_g1_i1.p1 TRINITY_DN11024_c0_g1~~TRINITY_DN11024_c0_g1_i1.p1  ORF type:complete len:138 (-),score=18.73 TRINITY_DN11024_c0_g1_i1:5-367(-)
MPPPPSYLISNSGVPDTFAELINAIESAHHTPSNSSPLLPTPKTPITPNLRPSRGSDPPPPLRTPRRVSFDASKADTPTDTHEPMESLPSEGSVTSEADEPLPPPDDKAPSPPTDLKEES